MSMVWALLLIMAAAIVYLNASTSGEKQEMRLGWGILIFVFSLMAGIGLDRGITLPGTDATVYDMYRLVHDCESTLRRDQQCAIDFQLRPEPKEGPDRD